MTTAWARYAPFGSAGYEVSSAGDKRFSALYARLADGRTIEEAYQLDVKGYRAVSNNWRTGKGRAPLNRSLDLYFEYYFLWAQWAYENPSLMEELRALSTGKTLTDRFASGPVSQARALAELLNATAFSRVFTLPVR